MPKSMTGYGKSRLENDAYTQVWEVRGVNGRFLDLKWRLPYFLRSQEAALERVVREAVARGRVEIHLEFTPTGSSPWKACLNKGLAGAMVEFVSANPTGPMNQAHGQRFLLELPAIRNDLPFSPALLDRLFRLTDEDGTSPLESIAAAIAEDQGLSARVLAMDWILMRHAIYSRLWLPVQCQV